MKIEFFHDVICSFCFPMSYRMRELVEAYPKLDIVHRSFALAWEAEDFIREFGSRAAVKGEVVDHWAKANRLDEKRRFNIEGMKATDFDFPLSKTPLKAAKTAGLIGGETAYWDAFDALQDHLFVKNENIEDLDVIRKAIAAAGIDVDAWQAQYDKPETEAAVLEDLDRIRAYGITVAPTLIFNEKYQLSGVITTSMLQEALEEVAKKEGIDLESLK